MLMVFAVQFAVTLLVCLGAVAVVMEVPGAVVVVIWGVTAVTYAVAQICLAFATGTANVGGRREE